MCMSLLYMPPNSPVAAPQAALHWLSSKSVRHCHRSPLYISHLPHVYFPIRSLLFSRSPYTLFTCLSTRHSSPARWSPTADWCDICHLDKQSGTLIQTLTFTPLFPTAICGDNEHQKHKIAFIVCVIGLCFEFVGAGFSARWSLQDNLPEQYT